MIIVKDERVEFSTRKCEQCGKVAAGREIEAVGFIARESRGWYFLCFGCWRPHIHWKHNEKGAVMVTPVSDAPTITKKKATRVSDPPTPTRSMSGETQS